MRKSMPIQSQKPWVKYLWLGLGIASLLNSIGFSIAAANHAVPVTWAFADFNGTALWFAFGCFSTETVMLLFLLSTVLWIGATGSGNAVPIAFGSAALIAYRALKKVQEEWAKTTGSPAD